MPRSAGRSGTRGFEPWIPGGRVAQGTLARGFPAFSILDLPTSISMPTYCWLSRVGLAAQELTVRKTLNDCDGAGPKKHCRWPGGKNTE
jgi:hypothetical protein